MELYTVSSTGVLLATVGYYFRKSITYIFGNPQILKYILDKTLRSIYEAFIMISHTWKEILILLTDLLLIMIHLIAQITLFIKNSIIVLNNLIYTIYVLFHTGNTFIRFIIDSPKILYDWLTGPPYIMELVDLGNILIIFIVGYFIIQRLVKFVSELYNVVLGKI